MRTKLLDISAFELIGIEWQEGIIENHVRDLFERSAVIEPTSFKARRLYRWFSAYARWLARVNAEPLRHRATQQEVLEELIPELLDQVRNRWLVHAPLEMDDDDLLEIARVAMVAEIQYVLNTRPVEPNPARVPQQKSASPEHPAVEPSNQGIVPTKPDARHGASSPRGSANQDSASGQVGAIGREGPTMPNAITSAGTSGSKADRANARQAVVRPRLSNLGLSVLKWTEKAGVNEKTGRNYLSGETLRPQAEIKLALAGALGLKAEYLPD